MPQRYQLGLLGYPVEHSVSPCLHQAALHACGLEGEYRLFEVAPGTESEAAIRQLLAKVRTAEVHGLNVTIPYKQAVLTLLDELADAARGIGAVNTIYLAKGALVGENTDAAGFLADLREQMAAVGWQGSANGEALVLGAGGAARAVVYALLQEGWRIHVAARRVGQAEELARSLQAPAGDGARITPVELSTAGLESLMRDTGAGLIVNTTPLGMATERDATPWPVGFPFPAKAILYDLVYNPAETALMRAAREAGLAAAGGIGMLIEQALRAFTIWTGCTPPRQAMQQAVHAYFRERTGDQP